MDSKEPLANRKYKDSLFASYFSKKERLIDAYNALAGTNYPPDVDIEYATLQNVFFRTLRNDLAFTLEGRFIVLIEQQASWSDNIVFRLMLYIARVYEVLIEKKDTYSKKRLVIPTPEFYVLYNGQGKAPAIEELRLSALFAVPQEFPQLELKAKVYDLSADASPELLAKSRSLFEYATFVRLVYALRGQGCSDEEAIQEAIAKCKKDGIMAAYLDIHSSEVNNMLLDEWDFEEELAVNREEAFEEGLEKGIERGIEQGIERGQFIAAAKMLAIGLDIQTIIECTGLSSEQLSGLQPA